MFIIIFLYIFFSFFCFILFCSLYSFFYLFIFSFIFILKVRRNFTKWYLIETKLGSINKIWGKLRLLIFNYIFFERNEVWLVKINGKLWFGDIWHNSFMWNELRLIKIEVKKWFLWYRKIKLKVWFR